MSVQKDSKLLIAILAAASASMLMIGCGQQTSETRPTNSVPPHQTTPAPQNGPAPNSNLAGSLVSTVDALMGTYSATMTTEALQEMSDYGPVQPQIVSIALYKSQNGSALYPYANVQISGPLASMSFNTSLSLGLWDFRYNGGYKYSFITKDVTLPSLTTSRFALELVVALRDGNQFDPTQSKIRILDCGFSQGVTSGSYSLPASCGNELQDVIIRDDLGKR